ncbi:hypothetical protein N9L18_00410 [Candidatus Pacebacteria bacterium]|nr:hypothetical protein [Candidatus Paceibacterota bacterium]
MKTLNATKVALMTAALIMTVGSQPMFAQAERKLREVRPLPTGYVVKKTTPKSNDRVGQSKQTLRSLIDSGRICRLLSNEQLAALIQVECSGRNGLIGDKHLGEGNFAYGVLQIRQVYVDDVNERYGTDLRASECLLDIELSKLVTQAYMNRYGKSNFSFEHYARMHNGGPQGWNSKYSKTYAKTTRYWTKVQKALATIQVASR